MKNDEQHQIHDDILESFRDHDREAWEKYQFAKLTKRHVLSATMEVRLEKQMDELIQSIQDEIEDDQIVWQIQQTYTTILIMAGYNQSQATQIAIAFASTYPRRRHGYGL